MVYYRQEKKPRSQPEPMSDPVPKRQPKLRIIPNLQMVMSIIPKNAVESVYNPAGDGNCGFRALAWATYGNEHLYEDIKTRMAVQFLNNKHTIYRKDDAPKIEAILARGSEKWFMAPECVQIAADTFRRPIAFYGSTTYLYIPSCIPPAEAASTHPIILQLRNAHFILVCIREDVAFQWPEISPTHPGFAKSGSNITDDPWYETFFLSFEYAQSHHQAVPEPNEDEKIVISDSDSDGESILDLNDCSDAESVLDLTC